MPDKTNPVALQPLCQRRKHHVFLARVTSACPVAPEARTPRAAAASASAGALSRSALPRPSLLIFLLIMICWSAVLVSPAMAEDDRGGSGPAPSAEAPVASRDGGRPEHEPASVGLEAFLLLIEPIDGPQVAKPIPGSRLTALVPGRETGIGVRYYRATEYESLGLSWEEFKRRAEAAASRVFQKLKPQTVKDEQGFARYAIIRGDSQLTAAAVLAPEFRTAFKESMGDDLIVLIPDRRTIYVFPRSLGEYRDFGQRILKEYSEASFPVSREVLLLNRDGLSCLGSFLEE